MATVRVSLQEIYEIRCGRNDGEMEEGEERYDDDR